MVTSTDPTSSHHAPTDGRPPTRSVLTRAWICIALVPVCFVVSFVVQTVIYALTGYDPGSGAVPLWASLAAGLPGLAVLLLPCVAGVVYGVRAVREGVRSGAVPAALAALLGLGAVALTVANL